LDSSQQEKNNGASKLLVSKNFKEYHLPPLGSVPVRTLTEFYIGAEPTWFDIYSGKIYQTRYFTIAKNTILGRKNLMLIGAAVTGKSTLLKQLANWFSSQRFGVIYR
jgi:polynucleotide 5'-kinase involved in rRNA processing